nr:MAG TPA: hypothetical protein [Caudoviricetes sp.]
MHYYLAVTKLLLTFVTVKTLRNISQTRAR